MLNLRHNRLMAAVMVAALATAASVRAVEEQADKPLPRVLFLTHSAGFMHDVVKRAKQAQLAHAEEQLAEMSKGFFAVDATQDCSQINAENLKKYKAVVFYTTGNLPISDEGKAALLKFVADGGGFAGSHCATDTYADYKPYVELIGGTFDGHPWHQDVPVKVDVTDHPSTKHLGKGFVIKDEIYQFRNYSREGKTVLMGLDVEKMKPEDVAKGKRADKDYAVAWTREQGKGRVFYTSLGHRHEVWTDKRFQVHLVNGILWTMRAEKYKPFVEGEASAAGEEAGRLVFADDDKADAPKPIMPFDGKTLTGWKFKDHGNANTPKWTVGTAKMDGADPRKLTVEKEGTEMINAEGHGVDIYSEAKFGDAVIELEVMVPKGSNSGIYVMGEYEVQVLDSYGKADDKLGQGDMGAIYSAAAPKINASKAPGEWQKYIIDFRAPKFDKDGKKVANAKFIKITLNGKVIQENVEVKGATPGGIDGKEKPQGPILFQGDHGPVCYRNIKVTPVKSDKKDSGADASDTLEQVLTALCAAESDAKHPKPTLGAKAPEGATILFDGKNADRWQHDGGKPVAWEIQSGVMTITPGKGGSIETKQSFKDFKLHMEFMVHAKPDGEKNWGNNGNSGIYIQRRYEVQILNPHDGEATVSDCGALYKFRKPDYNVTLKPGEWQSYDIDFRAARYDGEKKTENVRITVVHNGVTIHDNVELPNKTGAGEQEGPNPRPILLQDHGNVVSFRNIWIVAKG